MKGIMMFRKAAIVMLCVWLGAGSLMAQGGSGRAMQALKTMSDLEARARREYEEVKQALRDHMNHPDRWSENEEVRNSWERFKVVLEEELENKRQQIIWAQGYQGGNTNLDGLFSRIEWEVKLRTEMDKGNFPSDDMIYSINSIGSEGKTVLKSIGNALSEHEKTAKSDIDAQRRQAQEWVGKANDALRRTVGDQAYNAYKQRKNRDFFTIENVNKNSESTMLNAAFSEFGLERGQQNVSDLKRAIGQAKDTVKTDAERIQERKDQLEKNKHALSILQQVCKECVKE